MKILVAEDDPVSLRLLQARLDEWGYEVTSVTDGQKALEVLQGPESPRLAILDWIMPGLDGIEICREARKRGKKPYIYILMLTAKVRKQDIVEGLESGADDYLIKPYDPHELRALARGKTNPGPPGAACLGPSPDRSSIDTGSADGRLEPQRDSGYPEGPARSFISK
jgi:DNA-binding response OmpR family regulator